MKNNTKKVIKEIVYITSLFATAYAAGLAVSQFFQKVIHPFMFKDE